MSVAHPVRLRAVARGACLSMLALMATTAAMAQSAGRLDRSFNRAFDDAKRSSAGPEDARNTASEETSVPGTVIYKGAAAFAGYESNLDLVTTNAKGAAFAGIDAGIGAVVNRDGRETTLAIRGSEIRYDLSERPDRWDAGLFLDHHAALANGAKLTVGGFFYRNEIELDRTQRLAGYAALDRQTDSMDTFVRLRALNRDYLNAPGSLPSNSLLSTATSSLTNTRTELAGGVLLLKDQRIAPFIQGGGAVIDYSNHVLGDPNRDAREAFAIAGVRVRFNDKLHADIGARYNSRDVSDQAFGRYDNAFFDGKLVWTPTEKISAELSIERTLQDPIASNALFSEVTTAEVSLTVKPTAPVYGTVKLGIDRLNQVGAGYSLDERYLEGRLARKVSQKSEVFAFGKATNTTSSRDSKESVENYQVGVGFKIHN